MFAGVVIEDVGFVVSTVTERVAEPEDSPPDPASAVAKIEFAPVDNVVVTVHVHVVADATRLPQVAIRLPGAFEVLYNLIVVVVGSLVPLNVGKVLDVILSVVDEPVSDPGLRSGVDGLAGVAAKTDTDKLESKITERIANKISFDAVKVLGILV